MAKLPEFEYQIRNGQQWLIHHHANGAREYGPYDSYEQAKTRAALIKKSRSSGEQDEGK